VTTDASSSTRHSYPLLAFNHHAQPQQWQPQQQQVLARQTQLQMQR
jgi:hypothetical protein